MRVRDRIFISYLRVFAMLLILACHIVQEHNNSYINMTAQFLNVGVPIFIIISGCLYGQKEIKEKYFRWIIKRVRRILIPMYFFMVFLLIVNLAIGNNIRMANWIAYIFNLQGFQIYVHGAEHLWYLTIIMICYLITPILNKYRRKISNKNLVIYIFIGVLLQISISYFINTQLGIYLIYLLLYIISYIIGCRIDIIISKKLMFSSILLAGISGILRISARVFFDNSILYNVIVVGYTQGLIAFCIFYIFIYMCRNIKENKIINFLDSISFEIYLVHYMYVVGPLRLMGLTNSFIVNTIITLVISIVTAIGLKKICEKFYDLIGGVKLNKNINTSNYL